MAVKKVGVIEIRHSYKGKPWVHTPVGSLLRFEHDYERCVGKSIPVFPDKPDDETQSKVTTVKKIIKECPKCKKQYPKEREACGCGIWTSQKLISREIEEEKRENVRVPNALALEKYEQAFKNASEVFWKQMENKVVRVGNQDKAKNAVLYNRNIYSFDRSDYSDEECVLQIMNLEDEERRKFERLRNKFSKAEAEEKQGKRPAIPEDVRIAVWRRDEGKCTKCQSRDSLEYDHIIPISKGGSNTVRNIELLCEACNRSKSDNIQ